MASISLQSLTKRFGQTIAVNNLNLDLQEGELIALLGPSGCGKTTTLRMIAGFEIADDGAVYLAGEDVTTLPPERRNAGMVFQNYALFPHLSVFRNVAFGLEMRKLSKTVITERVQTILDKVQLSDLGDRYPRQLSGGQQQRTALARALVINPSVLLLDEPLANLDAKLREEMRFYIRSLQQEFGITTVYVTHDQSEALVLADRIAVMKDGVLQQIDAPNDIYQRPLNAWVADFVGLTNLIPATVLEHRDGILLTESAFGKLYGRSNEDLSAGRKVLFSVRPESLRLSEPRTGDSTLPSEIERGSPSANRIEAIVRERAYLGNLIDYRVEAGNHQVLRVQAPPFPAYGAGDRVTLTFSADEGWLIRDEGGISNGDARGETVN